MNSWSDQVSKRLSSLHHTVCCDRTVYRLGDVQYFVQLFRIVSIILQSFQLQWNINFLLTAIVAVEQLNNGKYLVQKLVS